MSNKTFMDWNPGEDWTVVKPKSRTDDAASNMNLDIDTTGDWFSFDGKTGSPSVKSTLKMDNYKANTDTNFFGDMFSSDNIGGTLQGIGSIGGALANIYGVHEQKKFNDDMLSMEKDRINRENKKTDKQQANYDAVWA